MLSKVVTGYRTISTSSTIATLPRCEVRAPGYKLIGVEASKNPMRGRKRTRACDINYEDEDNCEKQA